MPLPPASPLYIRSLDRHELAMLVTKTTAAQRAVRRAMILLDAANGVSNAEISRKTKMAREHIIAVRRRFKQRGMESVYADAPGRGRPCEIGDAKVAKIITATRQTLPKNATHWTADEMAALFRIRPR